MPQLSLNFIDIPIPETHLWEQFDDAQKRVVLETLVRLLVKVRIPAKEITCSDLMSIIYRPQSGRAVSC